MERIVKGFKLLDVIGRGGMAVVYKAIQTSLNRTVAVKELHAHLVQDKEFIDRFQREATAAANLHHENIIIIHDYGPEERDGHVTSYIIAMEYVEGKSLKDLLEGGKKLPVPVALNIFVQICRGLEHAHNRGVIHRDIKPANIIIANDGYVKIADFGLAHSSQLPSMTVTGATLGTPAYMSPEQAAGNRKIDARADIFSLGVVMYECLTGIKPFLGENYPQTITKILTHNPEPVIQLNPSIPPELANIIDRCISKDADKRYPSVAEILKELQFCAEKNDIRIEHQLLREFVKSPEEFETRYNAMLIKQYMDKGLYYMNLGFEKIDDAIQMFSKILALQPDNTFAREYLEKLNNEKKKLQRGISERKTISPHKEEPKAIRAPEIKEKRRGAGIYIIAGMAVILITGGVVAYLIMKGTAEEAKPQEESPTIAVVQPPPQEPPPPSPPPATSVEEKPVQQEIPPSQSVSQEKEVIPSEQVESSVPKKSPAQKQVAKKPEPKREIKKESPVEKQGVKQKEVVAVNIAPERPPQESQPPPFEKIEYSYLMVKVNPWADVYIDGKLVARTPLKEPIPVPVGEHTVKLVNPEFSQFEKKINFKPKTPDKPLIINISLEPIGGK